MNQTTAFIKGLQWFKKNYNDLEVREIYLLESTQGHDYLICIEADFNNPYEEIQSTFKTVIKVFKDAIEQRNFYKKD